VSKGRRVDWHRSDVQARPLDQCDGRRQRARPARGEEEEEEQADRTADVVQANRILTGVVSIESSFSSGRRHSILRRPGRSRYNAMLRQAGVSVDPFEGDPVPALSPGAWIAASSWRPSPPCSRSRCTAASRTTVATWRAAGRKRPSTPISIDPAARRISWRGRGVSRYRIQPRSSQAIRARSIAHPAAASAAIHMKTVGHRPITARVASGPPRRDRP